MRLLLLATFTMSLFAANSLLCRLALLKTGMDALAFTMLRMISGAASLWLLTRLRRGKARGVGGSFAEAAALFAYMFCFSLAYRGLGAATGTLILVVSTLLATIVAGRLAGETTSRGQVVGGGVTLGGLVALLAPSLSVPSLQDSALMATAGAAWAVYSILGKNGSARGVEPALETTGNFIRGVPFALALLPFVTGLPGDGVIFAVASGAVASGLGYVLWYRLVKELAVLNAALVQLIMPVLTALGAWLFLGEAVTLRLFVCGFVILCGIGYTHVSTMRRAARTG